MIEFKNSFVKNLNYQIYHQKERNENFIPRLQARLDECLKKFGKVSFRQNYMCLVEELTEKIKQAEKRRRKRALAEIA